MEPFVIGFTGSFGSGCSFIAKKFFDSSYYYISLSDILRDEYIKENPKAQKNNISRTILQDFGNLIREKNGLNYLAKKALERIIESGNSYVIVDSIRNPEEINYIKEKVVDFYVFGIFADQDIRWKRIRHIYNDDQGKFNHDERRDKGEKFEHGQRVTDCFLLSDVILINNEEIRGNNDAHNEMKAKILKYVDLFQGKGSKTPVEMEAIMAMAYANSMRSSCIKRKVGAVIVDHDGNIFSSGYNEVPPLERPCLNQYGECYRNYSKNEISGLFSDGDDVVKQKVMDKVKLLEKCRALHAEENAILNIAKSGSASVIKNATLYTTTYPCNLCANKIAQVNIEKIVYFEPYPVEEAKKTLEEAKIKQQMFEGITYNSYFKVYGDIIF